MVMNELLFFVLMVFLIFGIVVSVCAIYTTTVLLLELMIFSFIALFEEMVSMVNDFRE